MSETQIIGFQVPASGTYLLIEDVVSALRAYAQSLEDPNAGAAVHDAASWIDGGRDPQIQEPVAQVAEAPHGAEADDVTEGVDRIEVYPDPPDDPKPKWYARSIDTSGYIIKTTDGSFDQAFVIQNARERWPDHEIHMLRSAGEDSMWTENSPGVTNGIIQTTRGTFPSVGPPIRRLWAGAGR